MTENVTGARAGRREWIGLAVLALACLLYSMDLTVLNLALPAISTDLEPSSAQLLWIVDVYGFVLAGSLITMGTLGDRIGRRRLLLIGAVAFAAASVLAAMSTSAEMLIASRALLGLAGATLAPSTLSLIRNMFLDPGQRTVAIGVWITSFSAGAVIGPPLGGLLLEFFWWGSVFLLALPVMALILVLGPVLLPEFKDPDAGRLDLVSAALSLAAVLAVIYGLKQVAQDGLEWSPALSIAAGLGLGALFVRRQQRLADPLIDLRLFRVPAFSASLAAYLAERRDHGAGGHDVPRADPADDHRGQHEPTMNAPKEGTDRKPAPIGATLRVPSQGESVTPREFPVPTQTPGNSKLKVNPQRVYHYNWKTLEEWAGTCRELVLTRDDGRQHRAFFRFI